MPWFIDCGIARSVVAAGYGVFLNARWLHPHSDLPSSRVGSYSRHPRPPDQL